MKAKKYFRTDIKYADTISTKVRLQMNVAWCKVKNKIEKQLDRYFSRETKQFLRVCRLLDPRNFKSTSKIQNYYDFCQRVPFITYNQKTAKEFKIYLNNCNQNNYCFNGELKEFWISTRSAFPSLCKVAIRILSVPTSSAAVERSFSVQGQNHLCYLVPFQVISRSHPHRYSLH